MTTPDVVHAEHLRLGFRSGNCERCTPRPDVDDQGGGAGGHSPRPTSSALVVAEPAP